MSYNQHQQGPFWDWVNAQNNQNHGAGVDHQAPSHPNAFPFSFFGPSPPEGGAYPHQAPPPPHSGHGWPFGGPGPFGPGHPFGGHRQFGGRGGRRGRCNRREDSHERATSQEGPSDQEALNGEPREGSPHRGHHGERHGRHGRRGGWGGPRSRGFPGAGPGGFDLNALLASLTTHPIAEAFRNYTQQAGGAGQRSAETVVPENNNDDTFTPPVDVFSTPTSYILHVALPGAKKEDVGVNWDAEKGVLNLAGVIYRQGDEEFLKNLSQSERKVGVFERTIKLPPGDEEKEEVDGDAITAKLEDGVLVVTVAKLEKEWIEVKRVDIE